MAGRGKVMVVDDDPIVLRLTAARLEGAGFEVVTREEALGTTQAIIDEEPDLVLLDLQMPALHGDALATLARKHPSIRGVSIVFHSTAPLTTLQEKARETGALGAISKTGNDLLFIRQFERLWSCHRGKIPP